MHPFEFYTNASAPKYEIVKQKIKNKLNKYNALSLIL